jgi:hypothetical protein
MKQAALRLRLNKIASPRLALVERRAAFILPSVFQEGKRGKK